MKPKQTPIPSKPVPPGHAVEFGTGRLVPIQHTADSDSATSRPRRRGCCGK